MEKSKIKRAVIPKKPTILLLGLPGPGLISTMSLTYIIHALKMDLIGEIESEPSSIVFIDNGQIVGPVRIYKKDNLFAILSDIPIDYEIVTSFTDAIIEFAEKHKVNLMIFPSGIHVPERNPSNLKTFGLVTQEKLEKILYENEIPKFLSGVISGPDATILTHLKNAPVPSLVLHTECNYFFPDPDAAMQTIKILSQIIKIEIELTEFKKQMDYLRLQNRHLMDETLNVLQAQKEQSSTPPQIYK